LSNEDILTAEHLTSGYGDLQILRDINLRVRSRELISIVGPNGAGKTTLAKTLCGTIKLWSGKITLDGEDISSISAFQRSRQGLMLIRETGGFFTKMSLRDNLLLDTLTVKSKDQIDARMKRLNELFPILSSRLSQNAGTLSGGERKMLGLARCFIASPRVVIIDEPCFGLSPKASTEFLTLVQTIRDEGMTVILIEEDAYRVLPLCDRIHLMDEGKIVKEGTSSELLNDPMLKKAYLA